MEDDASVRKLVELILSKQFNIAETTMAAVPIPSCLLANDFPQRFQDVLLMKYMIFIKEWRRDVGGCSPIMLSSPKLYLECVIFACLTEYKCYQNVFESFISVCALLKLFNDEILIITGMDFRDLNTDVFMVLYGNVMKSTFYGEGGLQKFVEYIHCHRYLSWKWNRNDLVSTDEKTSNKIQKDIKEKREKEYSGRNFPETETDLIEIDATSIILVQKVLSSKSFKLHTLPNNSDMINLLEASRNEERIIEAASVFVDLDVASQGCSTSSTDSKTDYTINHTSTSKNKEMAEESEKEIIVVATAEFVDLDITSQGCSSSTSDSKTDYTINHTSASKNEEMAKESEKERIIEETAVFVGLSVDSQGCSNSGFKTNPTINNNVDNAQYENIIQAVIRHNRSRSSGHANSDDPIQKEADGILDHLKDTVKYLKTVLDDYDKV